MTERFLVQRSHPAPADEQLDLLGAEQVLERRLVGDHVEASPEGFELLLHALVQHVIGVLGHELLREKKHNGWDLTDGFVCGVT